MPPHSTPGRSWLRTSIRIAAWAVLAGVVALAVTVGVIAHARQRPRALPAPTGPFRVGRVLREWTDKTRDDPLAPQANVPRRLAVWIWYPADAATSGPTAAYAPGLWSHIQTQGFLAGPLDKITTSTFDDAIPAAGNFPLIVLEPGLGLSAPHFTTLAQDLASHGYVVAAVTPTYSANVTVLDGTVVERSDKGNPQDDTPAALATLVDVWAADARFTAGHAVDLRAVHADPAHVAYIGHSLGGAASLQACHDDSACAGAADLDGTPYGHVATTGLSHPFLLLSSQDGCLAGTCAAGGDPAIQEAGRTLVTASIGPHWAYSVDGAQHFNFTDYGVYYLAPPLQHLLGQLGSIDGTRGLAITAGCVLAFADHVLRGGPPPSDLQTRYPELHAVT